MLYPNTISEIITNKNTGVEYEIAMFYQLLGTDSERQQVLSAMQTRSDYEKIVGIIDNTDITLILHSLEERNLELVDVSFETQEDRIGPSDIVMNVKDVYGCTQKIGLSVKYANSCSLNITGRKFITDDQISELKSLLPQYTQRFLIDMNQRFGSVSNWLHTRKQSHITDEYVDLLRDAVIHNWRNVENKAQLLSSMFHQNSPIEFWLVTYNKRGYKVNTQPPSVDERCANEVFVRKYESSYIDFCYGNRVLGRMQVKFNNGFIEKCKKKKADIIWDGERISYGHPFSSWNFSTLKR